MRERERDMTDNLNKKQFNWGGGILIIREFLSGVVLKQKFCGEIQGNETLKWNLPSGTACTTKELYRKKCPGY